VLAEGRGLDLGALLGARLGPDVAAALGAAVDIDRLGAGRLDVEGGQWSDPVGPPLAADLNLGAPEARAALDLEQQSGPEAVLASGQGECVGVGAHGGRLGFRVDGFDGARHGWFQSPFGWFGRVTPAEVES